MSSGERGEHRCRLGIFKVAYPVLEPGSYMLPRVYFWSDFDYSRVKPDAEALAERTLNIELVRKTDQPKGSSFYIVVSGTQDLHGLDKVAELFAELLCEEINMRYPLVDEATGQPMVATVDFSNELPPPLETVMAVHSTKGNRED